jgi:hypothetical protein
MRHECDGCLLATGTQNAIYRRPADLRMGATAGEEHFDHASRQVHIDGNRRGPQEVEREAGLGMTDEIQRAEPSRCPCWRSTPVMALEVVLVTKPNARSVVLLVSG